MLRKITMFSYKIIPEVNAFVSHYYEPSCCTDFWTFNPLTKGQQRPLYVAVWSTGPLINQSLYCTMVLQLSRHIILKCLLSKCHEGQGPRNYSSDLALIDTVSATNPYDGLWCYLFVFLNQSIFLKPELLPKITTWTSFMI